MFRHLLKAVLFSSILIASAAHADVVDTFVAKNGYRVVYRFDSLLSGWRGYVATGANGPKVFYLAPDRRVVVYGLLTDPSTGREITGEDVRVHQASIKAALNGGLSAAPAQIMPAAQAAPVQAADIPFSPMAWSSVKDSVSYLRDGKVGSKDVVYVFFDPRCPHCHNYFRAIRSIQSTKEIRWVPVGVLSQESVTMAAALLADKRGAKALDLMMLGQLRPSKDISGAVKAKLNANLVAMRAADADAGVPFTVWQSGGKPVAIEGEMPANEAERIFK